MSTAALFQRNAMAKPKCTRLPRKARRWAVVTALKTCHHWDAAAAAKSTGERLRNVKDWKKLYSETKDVSDRKRSGRPKLLSAAAVAAALCDLVEEQQSAVKATTSLKQQGLISSHVSSRTVARAVRNELEQPQAKQIFEAHGVHQYSWLLDGARAHTAASSKQFYTARGIQVLQDWPANSPDINPIENAWAWLKREVYSRHHDNLDSLWEDAQATWASMPDSMLKNLMNSIATRQQLCVQRDGITLAIE